MKNKKLIFVMPLCFLLLFNGKKYEEAVKDRLFLPVKICLEGQDCGTSSQTTKTTQSAQVDVKK